MFGAPDAGKIPGVLGMQNVLNGDSMAVGVMDKVLYSSYTQTSICAKALEIDHQIGVMVDDGAH